MLLRASLLAVALFLSCPSGAGAQTKPRTPPKAQQPPKTAPAKSAEAAPAQVSGEAAVLADGWARLAKGDAAGAAQVAANAMAADPRSAAALVLAVDADLARGGSALALDTYDRWMGAKRVDEAHVLRRIARAVLVEASGNKANFAARLEALKALAADGDAAAAAELQHAAYSGSFGEARALAAIGNDKAVNILIAQLATARDKTPIIDALGDSGNKIAVPSLLNLLSDPNELNRAAAADALGRLGAMEATARLRPMLGDPFPVVRLKAAGALYRLGDSGGLAVLSEMAQSEHGAIRVSAAREMASQPDSSWQAMVRSLTSDPDPVVRLDAAKLIAPYDPDLARRVIDELIRGDNLAIQQAASAALVTELAGDFATLRRLFRVSDPLTRVRASARVVELTR